MQTVLVYFVNLVPHLDQFLRAESVNDLVVVHGALAEVEVLDAVLLLLLDLIHFLPPYLVLAVALFGFLVPFTPKFFLFRFRGVPWRGTSRLKLAPSILLFLLTTGRLGELSGTALGVGSLLAATAFLRVVSHLARRVPPLGQFLLVFIGHGLLFVLFFLVVLDIIYVRVVDASVNFALNH